MTAILIDNNVINTFIQIILLAWKQFCFFHRELQYLRIEIPE